MKSISLLLVLLTLNLSLEAQSGYYKYINNDGITESIELYKDGTFQYINWGKWVVSKTSGTWNKEGKDQISFHSEFQIKDTYVQEIEDKNQPNKIYFIITAENYKRGPKKIKSIVVNGNLGCTMDSERVLKDMEKRHKIMNRGSKVQRDSASSAYPTQYYQCIAAGVDSIGKIKIKFDNYQFDYSPENHKANRYIMEMKLSPDPTYRYFNNEKFSIDRKKLISKEGEIFKRKMMR